MLQKFRLTKWASCLSLTLVIGEVTEKDFSYGNVSISSDEALTAWKGTLEKVFPTVAVKDTTKIETPIYKADSIYVCRHKVARPKVFIPVFPGTNCEYDSTKAFERAGADVVTKVFKNLSGNDIRESVDAFEKLSVMHRSSCSRVDSPQEMSRMDLQNSSQLLSRMRRSRKQ